jgi:HK97 family phage portal protein
LPWGVIERNVDANGNITRKNLVNSPLAYILSVQPNDETDAQTFRETLLAHALSWGNGYAEIERNRAGQVASLWQIEPDRVEPDRDETGELFYKVNNGASEPTYLRADEMFHLKGLGYDGRVGYSVISYAARSIGLGMAAETYGASFFENGANPGGVLEHPNSLSDKAYDHLKESLAENHAGPAKALKPMILEEGMKFTAVTIPQRDAQFIESRQFNVTDIARWYGIPPHKLMDLTHATFTNIEHQGIEFVQDALIPWIGRLEMESRIKLIPQRNRARTETRVDVNGLLRGDSEARANFYDKMLKNGSFTINMVLSREGENQIGPEGDKRLVQLNQTTLEKIGEDEPATNPVAPIEEPMPSEEDIDAVAAKIFKRENARLTEARDNYEGKPRAFDSWLDRFADQHHDYIADHTAHIVKNKDYADNHIKEMRDNFKQIYQGADIDITPDTYAREIKQAMQ